MKKKIITYTFIIILVIFMVFSIWLNYSSFATDWKDIYKQSSNDPLLQTKNIGLGIIQAIGYTVSVVSATIIGIKYLLTSPDGKAEIKKQMYTYLIGCLLIFSGTVLISIIANIAYNTF